MALLGRTNHRPKGPIIGAERTCSPRATRTCATRTWNIAPKNERQSTCALPSSSDVNLFCYRNRIVDFDAQITNGAFDLGMAKQQLNGTQVAGSSIDQRGFGSA
jgi:hypothetical protein